MKKKVAFCTLGCKLNFSETSTLKRELLKHGYREVTIDESPDLCVINSCSVTHNANKKCQKIIKETSRRSPDAMMVVTGCFAQLEPDFIASLPGVNAVVGADEKFNIPEIIRNLKENSTDKIFHTEIDKVNKFEPSFSFSEKIAYHHFGEMLPNDRTRSFLKIQDGCDYNCSFCTIPLARGKSRSGSINEIKKQIRFLVSHDIKEIVLTGVNTGDFKTPDGKKLIDLLNEIDNMSEYFRLRISSIEPNLLENEIIKLASVSQKIMPHFHIPLQSGSDRTLKKMRRRYARELYKNRIEKIRTLIPHACIGADVMVGFPGETREDFSETCNFIRSLDISYLHVFAYSERSQTDAASMNNSVPLKVRNDRSAALHLLSDEKRRMFYSRFLGKPINVLFEAENNKGYMYGFSEHYIRVRFVYDPLLINRIVPFVPGEFCADGMALQGEINPVRLSFEI